MIKFTSLLLFLIVAEYFFHSTPLQNSKIIKIGRKIDEKFWILSPYLSIARRSRNVKISCEIHDLKEDVSVWLSRSNSSISLSDDGSVEIVSISDISRPPLVRGISLMLKTTDSINGQYKCHATYLRSGKYISSDKLITIRVKDESTFSSFGNCYSYKEQGSVCSEIFRRPDYLVHVNKTDEDLQETENLVQAILTEIGTKMPEKCSIFIKSFICAMMYCDCVVTNPKTYHAKDKELCPAEYDMLESDCIKPHFSRSKLLQGYIAEREERFSFVDKQDVSDCNLLSNDNQNSVSLQPLRLGEYGELYPDLECYPNYTSIYPRKITHLFWTRNFSVISKHDFSHLSRYPHVIKQNVNTTYSVDRYQCSLELDDGSHVHSNVALIQHTDVPYDEIGFCFTYKMFGKVCSEYISPDSPIHVTSHDRWKYLESELTNLKYSFIPTLSSNCRVTLLPLLCLTAFPKCNLHDIRVQLGYSLQPICPQQVENHIYICGEQYFRNKFVKNIISNRVTFYQNPYAFPRCLNLPKREYTYDSKCMFGDGVGYRGSMNVSVSGNACLPWNQTVYHDVVLAAEGNMNGSKIVGHNFCRNPIHHSYTTVKAGPFCVVSNRGVKQIELCAVDKCITTLYLYTAAGSSTLLFTIFLSLLLLCICIPAYRRFFERNVSQSGMHPLYWIRRRPASVTISVHEDKDKLLSSTANKYTEGTYGKNVSNESSSSSSECSMDGSNEDKPKEPKPFFRHWFQSNHKDSSMSKNESEELKGNLSVEMLIQSFVINHNYSHEKDKTFVEGAIRSVPRFYVSDFEKVVHPSESMPSDVMNAKVTVPGVAKKTVPDLKLASSVLTPPSSSNLINHSLVDDICFGYLKTSSFVKTKKTYVAVRKLLEDPEELAIRFSFLKHDNLLPIVGIMFERHDPIQGSFDVVFEYSLSSDVLHFIRSGSLFGWPKCNWDFLQIAKQVASGASCLASYDWVHGDISLRNCKVFAAPSRSDVPIIKISDFSRLLPRYRSDYTVIPTCSCKYSKETCTGRIYLPIRWISPEILCYLFNTSRNSIFQKSENIDPKLKNPSFNVVSADYIKNYCSIIHEAEKESCIESPESDTDKFCVWRTLSRVPGSREGDVWSFGILLYELYHSITPSSGIPIEEYITEQIEDPNEADVLPKKRPLLFGANVPGEMKQLMKRCLDPRPKKRPPLVDAFSFLEKLFQRSRNDYNSVVGANVEMHKESSPIIAESI